MKRICVYLDAELQSSLAAEAADEGMSLSAYIRSKLTPKPPQPSRFGVQITNYASRIQLIKAVRDATGWTLREAFDFYYRPDENKVITKGGQLTQEEAQRLREALEDYDVNASIVVI